MSSVEIRPVSDRHELRAFVTFPWRLYRHDPNWVPPLISERIDYLDSETGPFYQHADVTLLAAHRGGRVAGTIAAFVDRRRAARVGQPDGGFGFFEVVDDYTVAEPLLDAACDWLRARGTHAVGGPTSFTGYDCPGVLIAGADCPPVMLEAHTPPYYPDFLERYGFVKDHDFFAWRAFRKQFETELKPVLADLNALAGIARQRAGVTITKPLLGDWDEAVATTLSLFNETLKDVPDHVPMTKANFRRLVDQVKPFLDPDLALFAQVDGRPVGFAVAFPDVNRVLIHLNGRLFPLGWLKFLFYVRRVDVVTFKLLGVLEEYRRQGIDALLYLETLKEIFAKDYRWLDGSVTSEVNPMINRIAGRLGGERYKQFRLYQMEL